MTQPTLQDIYYFDCVQTDTLPLSTKLIELTNAYCLRSILQQHCYSLILCANPTAYHLLRNSSDFPLHKAEPEVAATNPSAVGP